MKKMIACCSVLCLFIVSCSYISTPIITLPETICDVDTKKEGISVVNISNANMLDVKINSDIYSPHTYKIYFSTSFSVAMNNITERFFEKVSEEDGGYGENGDNADWMIRININSFEPKLTFLDRIFATDVAVSAVKISVGCSVSHGGKQFERKTIEALGKYSCDANSDYSGGSRAIDGATQDAMNLILEEYAQYLSSLKSN